MFVCFLLMMRNGFKFPDVFRRKKLFIFYWLLIVTKFIDTTADQQKMQNIPKFQAKNDVELLSFGMNKFSVDLYKTLSQSNDGNMFFSPFSISAALAMVYMGAEGNTSKEMKKILNFPDSRESIQRAFKDIITNYQIEVPEYQLHTSNMAYIDYGLSVLESFSLKLKETFLASSKMVNFNDAEAASQEINSDVEKATNSKIQNIVSPALVSGAVMALVNAIYFKGLWLHQFDPKMTEEKPFWVESNKSVKIPMMSVKKDFRVADLPSLDAKLLAMHYQGERISFVILLPNQRDGLSALEQKLDKEDFSLLDKNSFMQKTVLSVPKFKLEESLFLAQTLKSMGIKDLFSAGECDLSGITGSRNLFVTHIIHKAFLEVNEEGSEAAAATGVRIQKRSLDLSLDFIVDRPFMFMIYDNVMKAPLFIGRLVDPVLKQTAVKDEL